MYRNPSPTVDIIIELVDTIIDGEHPIVLIERLNEPHGFALPGGFVDYGESLEDAAVREAKEETGLDVMLVSQLHTYSDPARDPRSHTISTVFTAQAKGKPVAGDDAGNCILATRKTLPETLAFDHGEIIGDYYAGKHLR